MLKLLFVGDSISLGLGAEGVPFPTLVERSLIADGLAVEARNAAINGATIERQLEQLPVYTAFRPDVVVLYVGSVDAIPVARRDRALDLVRLLPRRYQQPGWLQPRPYLPRRWLKRNLFAIPESFLRTRLNRAIIGLQGATNAVPPARFRAGLQQLLDAFLAMPATCIVIGLGTIDDAMFPAAEAAFAQYRQILRDTARDRACRYVEIVDAFVAPRGLLLLDKFHPSASGHRVIADLLLPAVRAAIADAHVAVHAR